MCELFNYRRTKGKILHGLIFNSYYEEVWLKYKLDLLFTGTECSGAGSQTLELQSLRLSGDLPVALFSFQRCLILD